jgi:hypothetical protein
VKGMLSVDPRKLIGKLPPPDPPRCKCSRCNCPYCGGAPYCRTIPHLPIAQHERREALRYLATVRTEIISFTGRASDLPPVVLNWLGVLITERLGRAT